MGIEPSLIKYFKNFKFSNSKRFNLKKFKDEYLDSVDKEFSFQVYYDCMNQNDALYLLSNNLKIDSFIVPSNLIGREYFKMPSITINSTSFIEVISGLAVILISNNLDYHKISITKLVAGETLKIEKGLIVTIINTSNINLVTNIYSSSNSLIEFNKLKNYNGALLYLIKDFKYIKNNNYPLVYELNEVQENVLKFDKGFYNYLLNNSDLIKNLFN